MPYKALVEKTVPVPRQKIWKLLADFGGIGKLMGPAVESCVLEGQGVGAIRRVKVKGSPDTLAERLDALVDGQLLSYSLVSPSSLPLEYYNAVVTLKDAPNGGCTISWGSNWVAKGAPEDAVRQMLGGMYGGIIEAFVKAAG
jgi:polyketide cyclase/dehydrase/lipid transport protein